MRNPIPFMCIQYLIYLEASSSSRLVLLLSPCNAVFLQSVSFVGGKPTFTCYLDTFPFPYYILLRDVTALPRTLSNLLRQV